MFYIIAQPVLSGFGKCSKPFTEIEFAPFISSLDKFCITGSDLDNFLVNSVELSKGESILIDSFKIFFVIDD